MTFECQCTIIGSLLFLTQEDIKQILSRATRIQKIQGRREELDQNKSLEIKLRQIQSKGQSEDGLQISPHI